MAEILYGLNTSGVYAIDSVAHALAAGQPYSAGLNVAQIEVSPDGQYAILISNGGTTVQMMTLAGHTVGSAITVGLTSAFAAVWAPDSSKAYVEGIAGYQSVTPAGSLGSVVSVTGATNTNITISPDGTKLYLTCGTSVREATIGTGTVTKTFTGGFTDSHGIAITPDGKTLFISEYSGGNHVWPIDIPSSTVGSAITVGSSPKDIQMSGDGATLWVGGFVGNLYTIDVATKTVTHTIPVTNCYQIALTYDGTQCWFGDYNNKQGNSASTSTFTIGSYVPFGAGSAVLGCATRPPPTTPATPTGTITCALGPLTLTSSGSAPTVFGTATVALGPLTVTTLAQLSFTASLPLGPLTVTSTSTAFAVATIVLGPLILIVPSSQHAGGGQLVHVTSTRPGRN